MITISHNPTLKERILSLPIGFYTSIHQTFYMYKPEVINPLLPGFPQTSTSINKPVFSTQVISLQQSSSDI